MPTPLKWTPEMVARFWNGLAELDVLEHMSFGRLASDPLVKLMTAYIEPGMRCLDYGGGSGHLSRALLESGISVAVFEPSDARAHIIEQQFGALEGFAGVIGPDDTSEFDAVLCTEVIEHILDEDLAAFVLSLNTRLRTGGTLLLTTPYNERLSEASVYCPECDSTFHRWQHVRSFDATSLRYLLAAAGFEEIEIALIGFNDPEQLKQFAAKEGKAWPHSHTEQSGAQFANVGAADHIFYFGRKKAGAALPDIAQALVQVQSRRHPWQLLNLSLPNVSARDRAVALKQRADAFTIERDHFGGIVSVERERFAANGAPADAHAENAEVAVLECGVEELRNPAIAPLIKDTREIQVRDGVSWRTLRKTDPPSSPQSLTPRPNGVVNQARDRVWSVVQRNLMHVESARRLQNRLDLSEHDLGETLYATEDFPYRVQHYAPGRILLGISSLASGGAERQTVYTTEGLYARGRDDLHVIVEHLSDLPNNSFYLPKISPYLRSIQEIPNEDLLYSDWARAHPAFWRVLGGYVANRILSAAKLIRDVAPETVQASLDWTNITMGWAAALAGVPKIFLSGRNLSPVHFNFFNWFMYPAYRALASHPNVHLFNNSQSGAEDYENWLRLPRGTITVVRNGADTQAFAPPNAITRKRARRHYGLSSDDPVIAGAFRLSAEKRPLLWLDTAAKLLERMPNAQFLLFGDGPMLGQVQSRVYRMGLGQRVHIGGVSKDIRFSFAAADLVLLTSLQEGTPNVLIEAQAMGIPVVTTPAFGAAEAVEDNGTGRVIDSSDPRLIADAVAEVLSNKELYERMRQRAPEWIKQRFGRERMIDDTLAMHQRFTAP